MAYEREKQVAIALVFPMELKDTYAVTNLRSRWLSSKLRSYPCYGKFRRLMLNVAPGRMRDTVVPSGSGRAGSNGQRPGTMTEPLTGERTKLVSKKRIMFAISSHDVFRR